MADIFGRMGADAKEAIPELIQAFKGDEVSVRPALGEIGRPALPSLLDALNGESFGQMGCLWPSGSPGK